MKFFLTLFLIVILAFIGFQIYKLGDQKSDLNDKYSALVEEQVFLLRENQELQDDLKYFGDDINLSKELRSKFNYKYPSEELLILVPGEVE